MILHLGLDLLLTQSLNVIESTYPLAVQPVNWTQILTVVVVGLLIALTLQFLLFLVGSAIAISILPIPSFNQEKEPSTAASSPVPIGFLAGFGVFSTVNTVLFVASFFAIALSHFEQPLSGAIAGIVLWAAYCLLVLWLSLKTLANWSETLLNVSTAGLRHFFSVVSNLFQPQQDAEPLSPDQVTDIIQAEIQTAFATLQAQIRSEAAETLAAPPTTNQDQNAFDPEAANQPATPSVIQTVWQGIQQHIRKASAKQLAPKHLDRTLRKYLAELPQTRQTAVSAIDTQDLISIVTARDDLSKKKQDRIIQQVETAWQSYINALEDRSIGETTDSDATSASSSAPSSDKPHIGFSLPDPATLQTALEQFNDQILPQLPDVVQQNWTTLAPLATTIAQTRLEDVIAPMQAALHSKQVQHHLGELLDQSQSSLADLNQTVGKSVGEIRDRATEQLIDLQHTIQQSTQTRLNTLGQEAQARLKTTRKSLATALWWIVATTCTGGISAALAGAIAAGFNPLK